ncbi:MAG: hypothetical protein OXG51_06180 [Gammaproteobacteria bacterium]|nr:hypothetical protein [Gammaproteobacteria bacterium]
MTVSHRGCPIVAETPATMACFFGFHDVTPWNPANDTLAVLRVDPALRALPNGEVAEVCLWRPGDEPEPVGATAAWNFQMGARSQWLADGRLLYNVVEGGELGAVAYDPESGSERRLPFAVGAVDRDGRESISPHYGRLARHWPAYGVACAAAPSGDAPAPDVDGLWRMDLTTGSLSLFLSLAEVAAFRPVAVSGHIPHFLSHPLYSPSSRRVAFMHRFFTADGALYSRLLVAGRRGTNLRLLAEEKVSHFCWRDDDTILLWTRRLPRAVAAMRRRGWLASPMLRPALRLARRLGGRAKQALTGEHYVHLQVEEPSRREVVGPDCLPVDGHPMYRPGGRWFVTDTYPDANRQQALILFDTQTGQRLDIGSFRADPAYGDRDLKCDLHPRWDGSGRFVCVDTTRHGNRQCAIVDVRPALELA